MLDTLTVGLTRDQNTFLLSNETCLSNYGKNHYQELKSRGYTHQHTIWIIFAQFVYVK